MCNMYTYATYITYLKPQTWSNSLGECIEKGGKGEHKTAILENQMLEVRGEGKDSPKSYWEKLGRRQMNKNTGGQREGSLGTWRMEGSSLICTLSTDVTSETSIMTHYITAKDWEPYLVCVISLNSYNQKKKKITEEKTDSMKWSTMPRIPGIPEVVALGCEPKSEHALPSWHCAVSKQVPLALRAVSTRGWAL